MTRFVLSSHVTYSQLQQSPTSPPQEERVVPFGLCNIEKLPNHEKKQIDFPLLSFSFPLL